MYVHTYVCMYIHLRVTLIPQFSAFSVIIVIAIAALIARINFTARLGALQRWKIAVMRFIRARSSLNWHSRPLVDRSRVEGLARTLFFHSQLNFFAGFMSTATRPGIIYTAGESCPRPVDLNLSIRPCIVLHMHSKRYATCTRSPSPTLIPLMCSPLPLHARLQLARDCIPYRYRFRRAYHYRGKIFNVRQKPYPGCSIYYRR